MKKKLIALVFMFSILVEFANAQCAMCKKVASDAGGSETGNSVGEQLNSGILYLLIIPYIILFVLFRKKLKGFWKEFKSAGR